jgi:hypothetical protein
MFGVVAILCATSIFWLQGLFDSSDHTKGRRLVQGLRRADNATETFQQYIERRHGGQPGLWTSEVTGGCRGVVQVSWSLPGNPPVRYAWDVEIPSQTVHPTPSSPEGERILRDFIEGRTDKPLELPPLDPSPTPSPAGQPSTGLAPSH